MELIATSIPGHPCKSRLLRPGRGQNSADGAVRVVRCSREDVGKNVVVNVDSEGHGSVPSSFGGLDQFGSAAADHEGWCIGWPGNDRRHDRCVRHAQTPKAVDAKFAVHHGIGAGTDLRGAHCVTETGRGSPREVDNVLSAGCFGARNGLSCTDAVEGGLAASSRAASIARTIAARSRPVPRWLPSMIGASRQSALASRTWPRLVG